MEDRPEQETGAVTEQPRDSVSQADVGGKVSAIIEAAERAADEIMRKAEQEAAAPGIAKTRG